MSFLLWVIILRWPGFWEFGRASLLSIKLQGQMSFRFDDAKKKDPEGRFFIFAESLECQKLQRSLFQDLN